MIHSSESRFRRAGVRAARPLVIFLALALAPTAALAHAKLTRSNPKANSSLAGPPALVELWFSEELEPGFNTIEVKDRWGRRVDRGQVTLAEGGKKAQVELETPGAGKFTVVWKVLSKDEHTIRGRFTFQVTAESPAAPAAAVTPPPAQTSAVPRAGPPGTTGPQEEAAPETAGAEESTVTWADNAVRWLAYLAMTALFGGFATRLFVLGPALSSVAGAEEREAAVGAGDSRSVLLLRLGVVTLFLALPLSLVFQSSAIHGVPASEALAPERLGAVITQTGFGTAWLVAVVAVAALAVIVFLLGRPAGTRPAGGQRALWLAGLAASAALLVAPSLTGHAMASAKEHHLAVVSDWLHLVAGGFWVGGLFHLALAMPAALSRLAPEQRLRALGRVIALFTRIAVPSVALVFLAGLYNSWIHVGSFGALWGTAYGKTLLVKLLLVAPMLLLGALNSFHFGRRAARPGGGEEAGRSEPERGFIRSVRLEAALGALVLLAAAVLVFMTPAR